MTHWYWADGAPPPPPEPKPSIFTTMTRRPQPPGGSRSMNDDSDGVIGWAVAYPVSDPPPPQYPYSLTRNGALWFNRDQATDHHATAASLGHGWEKAFLVEVRRADVAERERRELAEYRRRYGTLDEEATA